MPCSLAAPACVSSELASSPVDAPHASFRMPRLAWPHCRAPPPPAAAAPPLFVGRASHSFCRLPLPCPPPGHEPCACGASPRMQAPQEALPFSARALGGATPDVLSESQAPPRDPPTPNRCRCGRRFSRINVRVWRQTRVADDQTWSWLLSSAIAQQRASRSPRRPRSPSLAQSGERRLGKPAPTLAGLQ